MKLRNKKTGEIVEAESCNSCSGTIGLFFEKGRETDRAYETLTELNEEWEDYSPKEPLIKCEKIRKIIREWAELNAISEIIYSERNNRSLCELTDYGVDDTSIEFVGRIPTLKDGETYTIAELCGEKA